MGRLTKQKNILFKEVRKIASFFDAELLYQRAKKTNSKLGIATVYRFLNDLERGGEIHSYTCKGRKIYSRSQKNHIHFTCEKCDASFHIKDREITFLKNVVAGEICHFQIDITGVCSSCLKK